MLAYALKKPSCCRPCKSCRSLQFVLVCSKNHANKLSIMVVYPVGGNIANMFKGVEPTNSKSNYWQR